MDREVGVGGQLRPRNADAERAAASAPSRIRPTTAITTMSTPAAAGPASSCPERVKAWVGASYKATLWAGRDWDALSTDVAPPMAATGALIVTTGFIVPLVGPRLSTFLRSVTAYIHLLPLWRQLRSAPGEHAPLPGIPRFASLQLRLTVRETVLNDELLRLQPFLDDDIRERAHATADEGHADPDDAEMIGLAAMVAAAIDKKATSPEPVPAPSADPPERSPGAAALTDAVSPGRERLVALSRALRSPIVAAARRGAAATPSKEPTAR